MQSGRLRLVSSNGASGAGDSDRRSDAELCQAFLDGAQGAFGVLCQRHGDTVLKLVRRFAASPEDALDLTQRAFLQALEAAERALPRLLQSGEDVPFRAWLLRIAINLGKNHVRDSARWPKEPVEALERMSGAADPEAQVERARQTQLVKQAVLVLPRRQREVFTLRIDGGLSFAEVAQTLGISEGNAKAHFHHAVKRLRDEVQQVLGGAS